MSAPSIGDGAGDRARAARKKRLVCKRPPPPTIDLALVHRIARELEGKGLQIRWQPLPGWPQVPCVVFQSEPDIRHPIRGMATVQALARPIERELKRLAPPRAAGKVERRKAYLQAWRAANREKARAIAAAWRAAHPEKVQAWRAAHAGKARARKRARYATNADEVLARHRAEYARNRDHKRAQARGYYRAHREQERERRRSWQATHPEWRRAYAKEYYQAHKAEILAQQRALRAAAKLARTISTASPAAFRLTLPLPDLAELAHLAGGVAELPPDGLRVPAP